MLRTKNFVCATFVMALMLLFMGGCFAGCGKDSAVYSNIMKEYNAVVEANTDIFNDKGFVEIKYSTPFETMITSNSQYSKLRHTSYVADDAIEAAVLEPVFASSFAVVAYYVNRVDLSRLSVSSDTANDVLNQLKDFSKKLEDFVATKHTLDARPSLDINNVIIQKELLDLSQKFKGLAESSCLLGEKFSNLYANEIFEQKEYTGGRYQYGQMRLVYFEKLVQIANFELNAYVNYYYNKTEALDSVLASEILLSAYNEINAYSLWEETTEQIYANEDNCIKAFKKMLEYDSIFENELDNALLALSKIEIAEYYKFNLAAYKDTDFDATTRVCSQKINQFVTTYAENMKSYMQQLVDNIKILKNN